MHLSFEKENNATLSANRERYNFYSIGIYIFFCKSSKHIKSAAQNYIRARSILHFHTKEMVNLKGKQLSSFIRDTINVTIKLLHYNHSLLFLHKFLH